MSARRDTTPQPSVVEMMAMMRSRVVTKVRSLPPSLQVTAIWLYEQADGNDVIDDIDWERLAEDTSIAETTLRRVHLRDSTILTTQGGFIEREERLIGGSMSKPIFRFYL